MRILLSSHFFAPSVGGIEQVSGILAEEFCRLGHEVHVLTTTTAEAEPAGQPFQVFRRPSLGTVFRELRWCDVHLQSNISLATFWPAVLLRKPTLIVYHTWLSRVDGSTGWQDRLKRFAARFASKNLGVSSAVARSVSASCGTVPNPYRDDLFGIRPEIERDRDLVFLGRLVSDKGADILLDALARMKKRGETPTLSIIGTGEEDAKLRRQSDEAGLSSQVLFLGKLTGEDLVRALNRHRVMVVPSRWQEPFGLVALEALACGLIPVGSSGGGLSDAMGACGVVFPSGDAAALADRLSELLANPATQRALLADAPAHLARHSRRAVAETYLEHFAAIRR